MLIIFHIGICLIFNAVFMVSYTYDLWLITPFIVFHDVLILTLKTSLAFPCSILLPFQDKVAGLGIGIQLELTIIVPLTQSTKKISCAWGEYISCINILRLILIFNWESTLWVKMSTQTHHWKNDGLPIHLTFLGDSFHLITPTCFTSQHRGFH